jgi:hypothetical protein
VLSYLASTHLVARSFIDKPNGSNSIEPTSKGPAESSVGPAGLLVSTARKRRMTEGWPTMMPVVVLVGAPMAAATAKEVGPTFALALAVTKGGPTDGWGHATVVAPAAVPAGVLAMASHPLARMVRNQVVSTLD